MRELFSVKGERIKKLFRMDLHRIIHCKAFYVMIFVAIHFPVMLLTQMGGVTNIVTFIQGSGSFEFFRPLLFSMSNVLTGILLSIYIAQEYASGFIKNIAAAHANRFDYMIALICSFGRSSFCSPGTI